MHPTSITVGIPVGELAAAIAWYDAVLDRQPAIEPAAGIVEYEFAGTWMRVHLRRLGLSVGDVKTVPGVISFFDLMDPDNNALSCYQVLDSG